MNYQRNRRTREHEYKVVGTWADGLLSMDLSNIVWAGGTMDIPRSGRPQAGGFLLSVCVWCVGVVCSLPASSPPWTSPGQGDPRPGGSCFLSVCLCVVCWCGLFSACVLATMDIPRSGPPQAGGFLLSVCVCGVLVWFVVCLRPRHHGHPQVRATPGRGVLAFCLCVCVVCWCGLLSACVLAHPVWPNLSLWSCLYNISLSSLSLLSLCVSSL